MKLGNIILILILGATGYHIYSTLQAPPPPPAPVTQALLTPAPVRAPLTPVPIVAAPIAAGPVTPAPIASASPTPSGNWMYSVTSTPYDQTGGKRPAARRR